MFHLNQDSIKQSFQVKDETENIIAEGFYGIDAPDRSVLALVTKITITSSSFDQIDQLLSTIEINLGEPNHARVFTWLPPFDGQFDINQQKIDHKGNVLMMVETEHLQYDKKIEMNQQEQYELITDKKRIETYAQPLKDMMRANAFWAKEWTEQEARDRIWSATGVTLIVGRTNNDPCAFGRIFTVSSHGDEERKFAYLTDIAVSSSHHNKGLGLVVSKMLVKTFLQDHDPEQVLGLLCLFCADQGVGAIAAPKLYKKLGFEYSKLMQRHIALVHTDRFYQRNSS